MNNMQLTADEINYLRKQIADGKNQTPKDELEFAIEVSQDIAHDYRVNGIKR